MVQTDLLDVVQQVGKIEDDIFINPINPKAKMLNMTLVLPALCLFLPA